MVLVSPFDPGDDRGAPASRAGSGACARHGRAPLQTVFNTWLAHQPQVWRDKIEVIAMDGFAGFETAAVEELPGVTRVLDSFHVTPVPVQGPK